MPRRDTPASAPGTAAPSGAAVSAGPLAGAVQRLQDAVETAGRRARSLGRPVLAWASAAVPPLDPLRLLERAAARDRMLWARPEERFCLAGAGAAWTFRASGADRFARAEAAWRGALDQSVGPSPADDGNGAPGQGSPRSGPVAFFGFAFAPAWARGGPAAPRPAWRGRRAGWVARPWRGYPDALLVIPRVVVASAGGRSWIILAALADGRGGFSAEPYAQALAWLARGEGSGAFGRDEAPDRLAAGDGLVERGDGLLQRRDGRAERRLLPDGIRLIDEFPPPRQWKESVRATARAVAAGRLRKAVLARGIRVRARRLDPAAALRALRTDYPACTLFAVAREGRWFLGATPERLVRVRNGEASVAAVAGTAPRGLTVEEDRRLGEMLLASPKDRLEHAIVVEALREALSGVWTSAGAEQAPRLLTLRNAHHLHTPIRFALRDRETVLALTGRLHPTPAVGGAPAAEALRWIRRHEGWDRGWYAGPVGWMDRAGAGEAAVAIRCGLVHDTEALLFGGCGIVAASEPDQEYDESNLKLRPVASALAASAKAAEAGSRRAREDP